MQFAYGLWGKCMQKSLQRSVSISVKLNDYEKFTAVL